MPAEIRSVGRNDKIPVDFLNEMTALYLLETDGATWRFRHQILQEYFAGQWRVGALTNFEALTIVVFGFLPLAKFTS